MLLHLSLIERELIGRGPIVGGLIASLSFTGENNGD